MAMQVHTPSNCYDVLRTVGSGFCGKVKLARASDGTLVAVKLVRRDAPVSARTELAALRRVSVHPNIVRVLDHVMRLSILKSRGTKVVDALVLEWLPHGELFSYLVKTALPERIARRMFRQVLAAVQHCHDCGVFHRDVKPENVMFSSDFDPVLVDFGFAVQAADVAPRPCTPCTPVEPASPHVGDASDSDGRRSSDMALRGCGSPKGRSAPLVSTQLGSEGYFAPEIASGRPYNPALSDSWSLGCLLFGMLTRQMAFPSHCRQWYLDRIRYGDHATFFAAHMRVCSLTPAAISLLTRMICWCPDIRATLDEVASDPWVLDDDVASQEEYLAEMRGRWAVLSKAEEKQETDTSSTSTASNASKSSASRSPESTECGHLAAALEHLDLRA